MITFNEIPEAIQIISNRLQSIELLLSNKPQPEIPKADKLIGIDEACTFLGLAKATLYCKVNHNEIPYIKPQGTKKLYFSIKDLNDYMNAGRQKTNAEVIDEADKYIIRKGGNNA